MFLRALQWLAWLTYLTGCLLILSNTVVDYGPDGAGIFIFQKGEIGESAIWKASLYVHILGGMLCLFAALPQLSGKIAARFPSLHRISGRIYGASVLFLVCPTGFHLALYAKGGFLTLAFAAFYTTLAGWRAVLPPQRDMRAHRMWMIRSFALTASAVTFRIYHTLGYFAGLEADTNYIASLWLSLLGNAAVTELILHRKRIAAFLFPKQPQPQTEP